MAGKPNTAWMETMIKRYGSREAVKAIMQNIGSIGGSKGKIDGTIKGFAVMSPEKRAEAGRKGGKISRRGKANG